MRISEIKNCVNDVNILNCIKKDFWEDEYYRFALCKGSSPEDVHQIYRIIINAYLELIETDNKTVSSILPADNKKIKRLSKLIYNDNWYWTKGTPWEKIFEDRNNAIQKHAAYKSKCRNLYFLYDRLKLKKRKNNSDLVYLIAKCDVLYEIAVSHDEQIRTMNDLYCLFEPIFLELLKEREVNYIESRIIKSLSYLTFGESHYFYNRNGIDAPDFSDKSIKKLGAEK